MPAAGRRRPSFETHFLYTAKASDPEQLAKVLRETYDVTFLTADQLADVKRAEIARLSICWFCLMVRAFPCLLANP